MNSKLLAVVALGVGILIGANNFAMSDIAAPKIAVVDVQAVVAKSAAAKALKEEQVKKNQELAKWLETVKADINKQSTPENKQKLLKKYNDQLAKKKEANAKDYAKKLDAISKNVSDTINAQAKAKGYTLVLTKAIVLYGGDNITEDIAKAVK